MLLEGDWSEGKFISAKRQTMEFLLKVIMGPWPWGTWDSTVVEQGASCLVWMSGKDRKLLDSLRWWRTQEQEGRWALVSEQEEE